jgi:LPXTG-motif cell wall-anchored protein
MPQTGISDNVEALVVGLAISILATGGTALLIRRQRNESIRSESNDK